MARSKAAPPKQINIAGRRYTLVPVEPAGDLSAETNAGYISHRWLTINYSEGWHEYQQKDTVLHEVLHGCEDVAGLEVEERVILALSTQLLGVLKGNPEFVKWLIADED